MLCSLNPDTKLKIFISSAQRSENGFNWEDVRRKVKANLEECPCFKPFIIDATASEIPSSQYYQYQVLQSDIVVMLIKGECRPGTQTEFTTAIKNKKPLLIYFLKDEHPSLDVIRLKKYVQEIDCCTYRFLDSFDEIAETVRNGVITNVLEYYQFVHIPKGQLEESEVELSAMAEESAPLKNSIPTKTSIALFSSSYNHIFELLKIGFPNKNDTSLSPLHNLGISALDWLINGTPLNCETEIIKLCSCLGDIYENGVLDTVTKKPMKGSL